MKKLLISSLMLLSVFGLNAAPKRRASVRRPAAAAVVVPAAPVQAPAPVAPAPVIPKGPFDDILASIKNLNLQNKSTVAIKAAGLKQAVNDLSTVLASMTPQDIKVWDLNEKSQATGICKLLLNHIQKLLIENNSSYNYTYWLPAMLQSNDSTEKQLIELQQNVNACYSKINQDGIVRSSLNCIGRNKMKTASIVLALLVARKVGLFDMAQDVAGMSTSKLFQGLFGLMGGESLYAQGKIKFSNSFPERAEEATE